MSIIASTYNTGTGLSSSVAESTLPLVVDDLTVNGNLTVIETTVLNGETTITSNLTVGQTTTSNNAIINNNIILNNGVGQNNTALFKLPLTNGSNNQVLTITDQTLIPITTAWQSPTVISNYVQYDIAQTKLKNNVSGVVSNIDKIVINGSIGKTATDDFVLPTNTSTAVNGTTLAILDATASPKTTQWIVPVPPITNFVSYDTTTTKLKNNVSGVVSNIDKIVINGSIGKTATEDFVLPTNTSTAVNGTTLAILDATATPKTTQWIVPATPTFPDYVSYNTTTTQLSNNIIGTPTVITNLRITNIGRINNNFNLPSNTSTALNYSRLVLIDNVSRATTWYPSNGNVGYIPATKVLTTEDSAGAIPDITEIAVTKIGSSNAQLFSLPTNTSTATATYILNILDGTTKTTSWVPLTTTTTYINTTPQTQTTNNQRSITNSTSLNPGTYSITYSIEIQNTTGTTKAISYVNHGIYSGSAASLSDFVFGLTNAQYATGTIPVTLGITVPRYSGSGIVVLTTATTLYLKFYSIYTGTSYTVTGRMDVTKIG
jgi:hypothetical protein